MRCFPPRPLLPLLPLPPAPQVVLLLQRCLTRTTAASRRSNRYYLRRRAAPPRALMSGSSWLSSSSSSSSLPASDGWTSFLQRDDDEELEDAADASSWPHRAGAGRPFDWKCPTDEFYHEANWKRGRPPPMKSRRRRRSWRRGGRRKGQRPPPARVRQGRGLGRAGPGEGASGASGALGASAGSDCRRPDDREGRFAEARRRLDYAYHRRPVPARRLLQDAILGRVVDAASSTSISSRRRASRPWVVFTAGAMGCGKSYVLTTLHRAGLLPLSSFLLIDPDMLKNELPEMAGYIRSDPATAASMLHRESSLMADLLLEDALSRRSGASLSVEHIAASFRSFRSWRSRWQWQQQQQRQNQQQQQRHANTTTMPPPSVLVDGSLRNVDWYANLFEQIRSIRIDGDTHQASSPSSLPYSSSHNGYRIGILHVTCNLETALQRSRKRAMKTGRHVPEQKLTEAWNDVPKSVSQLSHLADACYTIRNDEGQPLRLLSHTIENKNKESAGNGGYDEEGDGDASPWLRFARVWMDDMVPMDSHHWQDGIHLATPAAAAAAAPAPATATTATATATATALMCRMADMWDDAEAHAAATAVWGSAYPNYCARCALSCDGQCGICIHGRHLCACLACSNVVSAAADNADVDMDVNVTVQQGWEEKV